MLKCACTDDDWKRDEYRAEDRFDNGIQDVEDLPDDAARWTGRKVQDVEDIPQDVEYGYDRMKYGVEDRVDNAVYDVEDAPEEVAGWAGRKVGDVERFDDNVGMWDLHVGFRGTCANDGRQLV